MSIKTGETLLVALLWILVVSSYGIIILNTHIFGAENEVWYLLVLLLPINFFNHLSMVAMLPFSKDFLHQVFWGTKTWQRIQATILMFPVVFMTFGKLEEIKLQAKKFNAQFKLWTLLFRFIFWGMLLLLEMVIDTKIQRILALLLYMLFIIMAFSNNHHLLIIIFVCCWGCPLLICLPITELLHKLWPRIFNSK